MGRRILVADDSSTIQKVIKIAFSRYNAEMIEAGSFIEALSALGRGAPDALILDASLPGARGPQDFAKLAESARGAPVLLLVGTYEAVDEAEFQRAGFRHFLKKPFDSSDLITQVETLLGGNLGQAETQRLQQPTSRPMHTTVIHPPGVFAPGGGSSSNARNPMPQGHVPPPPGGGRGGVSPPAFELDAEDLGDAGDGPAIDLPPGFLHGGGNTHDDDQDEDGPRHPVPPPPMTDQARRGQRAFNPKLQLDVTRPPEGEGEGEHRGRGDAYGDDDHGDEPTLGRARPGSPLPPIPPTAGMGGEGGSVYGGGSYAETYGNDHGDNADLGGSGNARDQGSARGRKSGGKPASGGRHAQLGDAPELALEVLRPFIDDQLPALVRQALEDYCERNFKSIAREVIATELRRLADEKARHLVDN